MDLMDYIQEQRSAAINLAREWLSKEIVVLDTETTGLGDHAKIVEIGIVDKKGDVLVDALVDPYMPIPPDATRVHGIRDIDVVGKPYFSYLWPSVYDAIRNADLVLIYNADYDCRLIRQSIGSPALQGDLLDEYRGQERLLEYGCIMNLYSEFYGEFSEYHGTFRWQSLGAAIMQCGLTMEGSAHRALTDAKAALAVLKYMAAMRGCQ